MKRLYIASIAITAAIVLATVSVATATYSHGPTAVSAALSGGACSLNVTAHPALQPATAQKTDGKAGLPSVRLAAQAQYATTCYTFAGPTCPMTVLVPPGSACTCYYPTYWLNGVAH
jgi:hypothetical protein